MSGANGKIYSDDPRGPNSDVVPSRRGVNLGSAQMPFNNVYAEGNVVGEAVLDNNSALQSLNAAGTSNLNLIKADATDNTVINTPTGKVGKLAVNGTTVGTYDSNSLDFPAYNLLDGSDKNYALQIHGAGTAYTLTAVSAAVVLGTTSPAFTINKAGTYLITARANLQFNGATFAASRTVTLKLRRTNNTPADVANGTASLITGITTTQTSEFGVFILPQVLYTTANLDDALTIFADVSVVPTAGSLQAVAASIVAVRLY